MTQFDTGNLTFDATPGFEPDPSLGAGIQPRDPNAFREQIRQEEADKPSFYEQVGSALASESTYAVVDWLTGKDFEVDPEFSIRTISDVAYKALIEDVPTEDLERLEEAVSYNHAVAIKQRILKSRFHQQQINAHGGLRGFGAIMVSAAGDPINLVTAGAGAAAGLGTRGILSGARGARAFSTQAKAAATLRNSRLISAGAGAATGGSIEGLIAASSPTSDFDEIATATLFGMAFGGGFGALGGEGVSGVRQARAEYAMRRIDAARTASALKHAERTLGTTGVLTEDGRRLIEQDVLRQREDLDDIVMGLGLDDTEIDAIRREFDSGQFDEAITRINGRPDPQIGIPSATMGAATRSDVTAAFRSMPEWLRNAPDLARRFLRGETDKAGVIAEASEGLDEAALAARQAELDELEGVLRLNERPEKAPGAFYADASNDARPNLVSRVAAFGMNKLFGTSEEAVVRKLGNMLVPNRVGLEGGRVQAEAMSEASRRLHIRNFGTDLAPKLDSAFKKHMEARGTIAGITRNAMHAERAKFDTDSFQAAMMIARGEDPGDAYTGAVIEAANAQLEWYAARLDEAKSYGVLLDVPETGAYLPRFYSDAAIDDLVAKHGDDAVIGLFRNALAEGRSAEDADKAAQVMFRVLRNRRYNDFDKLTITTGRDADEIYDLITRMRDDGDAFLRDITDDEALRISEIIAPERRRDGPTLTGREKRRTVLDDGATFTTDDGTTIAFGQMLERNGQVVAHQYSRQIAGAMVTKDAMNALSMELGEAIATPRQAINRARKAMEEARRSQGYINRVVANLETAFDYVANRSLSRPGPMDEFAKYTLPYQQTRLGGSFGVATLPEVGRVVGGGTARAILRNVPGFRELLGEVRRFGLSGERLRELRAMAGEAGELNSHRYLPRTDTGGGQIDSIRGGLQDFLMRTSRRVSVLSGQAHLTQGLKNMAYSVALSNMEQWARTGRGMGRRRLALLGLSEADADLIRAEMSRLGPNDKPIGIQHDLWKDQRLASRFNTALFRSVNDAITTGDIGSMRAWMTTPTARIILQFKSFAINAYENQLLRGIALRDRYTFQQFAFQFFAAAVAYTGQTYSRAIGQDDPESYIEDRMFGKDGEDALGVPRWARAAMQRAGTAAFVPELVDAFAGGAGFDPVFGARNTGQGALGNPTGDVAQNFTGINFFGGFPGQSLPAGIGGVARGERSIGDVIQSQLRFIPGNNLPVVENGLNAIGQSLLDD